MISVVILVLFVVALTFMPILAFKEVKKINREITVGNWVIKPTFSNSKSFKVNPRMLLFLIGVFTVVFVLLNVLNII